MIKHVNARFDPHPEFHMYSPIASKFRSKKGFNTNFALDENAVHFACGTIVTCISFLKSFFEGSVLATL